MKREPAQREVVLPAALDTFIPAELLLAVVPEAALLTAEALLLLVRVPLAGAAGFAIFTTTSSSSAFPT